MPFVIYPVLFRLPCPHPLKLSSPLMFPIINLRIITLLSCMNISTSTQSPQARVPCSTLPKPTLTRLLSNP